MRRSLQLAAGVLLAATTAVFADPMSKDAMSDHAMTPDHKMTADHAMTAHHPMTTDSMTKESMSKGPMTNEPMTK